LSRRNKRRHQEPTSTTTVEVHQPCDSCGSSDALARYDDGHTYCFACAQGKASDGSQVEEREEVPDDAGSPIPTGTAGAVNSRRLHQETCEKWGYLQGTNHGKPCQIAQYRDPETGRIVAAKVRYPDKSLSLLERLERPLCMGMAMVQRRKDAHHH
jgi:twinkle protein